MKVKSLSRVRLFATPWTNVAHQAPPSMGLSRQEYWGGLLFPSLGDLPHPGIEPWSPALQEDALTSEHQGSQNKNSLGDITSSFFSYIYSDQISLPVYVFKKTSHMSCLVSSNNDQQYIKGWKRMVWVILHWQEINSSLDSFFCYRGQRSLSRKLNIYIKT